MTHPLAFALLIVSLSGLALNLWSLDDPDASDWRLWLSSVGICLGFAGTVLSLGLLVAAGVS